MLGHRLLFVLAWLATLVLLGCWDNRRQLQRVLDEGYPTTAEITGAQYQRTLPFAVDGWWPRFVEQALSVDLKWEGKDGKPHSHRKVPITDRLAGAIVNGEQVRLIAVPVTVLDDDLIVPAIRTDAVQRLDSLQAWTNGAGYLALAAWAGFAAMTLWLRGGRRAAIAARGGAAPLHQPPRRAIAGMVLLFGGALATFHLWSQETAEAAARQRGTAVAAEIVDAFAFAGGHAVRVSWKDEQGAVRRYGPVPVSETYWRKITANGALTVKQAGIRYSPDDSERRPVMVDDPPEPGLLQRFGPSAGLVLMMVGAGCLFSAIRHSRRVGR